MPHSLIQIRHKGHANTEVCLTKCVHEGGVPLLQDLVGRGGPRVDAAQPKQDVFADLCVYVCVFMVCVWVSIKQTRGLGPAGIEGQTTTHERTGMRKRMEAARSLRGFG